VLIELRDLLTQFMEIAEKQKSFRMIAEILLLWGKMALLSLDMVEARKSLTRAQRLADEHNLPKLAGKISIEHDKLLNELGEWKNIEQQNTPIKERMGLARVTE